MALKYPDRLESNNPAAYGIVKATEVSGHKTVLTLDLLYTLADAILSDSGNNTDNDAIGQLWYVISEKKYYLLIDWSNRKSASGWELLMTDTEITQSQVLPDEEDITLVDLKLKLKDRAYDKASFSGKGYVILRKNLQAVNVPKFDLTITNGCTTNGTITVTLGDSPTQVEVTTDASTPEAVAQLIQAAIPESTIEGAIVTFTSNPTLDYSTTGVTGSVANNSYQENRNILTLEMINNPNTVYEIRYDFDLNGQEITIPENCVLKFNGGNLSNGIIISNNCIICGNFIFNNIQIDGNYKTNKKISKSVYSTLQDLINDNYIEYDILVETLGYYNEYDGGAATYKVVETTNNTVDNGSCIKLNKGYAILIPYNGEINAKQFGAISINNNAESVTDSTINIQNAIDYIQNNTNTKKLFINGFFAVKELTIDTNNQYIEIYGTGNLQKQGFLYIGENGYIDTFDEDSNQAIITIKSIGVNIHHLFFQGISNSSTADLNFVNSMAYCAIYVDSYLGPNTCIHDCNFYFFADSAIHTDNSLYGYLYNLEFLTSGRSAIHIDNCSSFSINNFAFDTNIHNYIYFNDKYKSIISSLKWFSNTYKFGNTFLHIGNLTTSNIVEINCARMEGSTLVDYDDMTSSLVVIDNINSSEINKPSIRISNINAAVKFKSYIYSNNNNMVRLSIDNVQTSFNVGIYNSGKYYNNKDSSQMSWNNLSFIENIRTNKQSFKTDHFRSITNFNNETRGSSDVINPTYFTHDIDTINGYFTFGDTVKLYYRNYNDIIVSRYGDEYVCIYPKIGYGYKKRSNSNLNIDEYKGIINSSNSIITSTELHIGGTYNINDEINTVVHITNVDSKYECYFIKDFDNLELNKEVSGQLVECKFVLKNVFHPLNVVGNTEKRPSEDLLSGMRYLDTTLNRPIWWNGRAWIDSNGYYANNIKGNSTQRPTPQSTDMGFEYYDSTIKKKILWNGTKWVDFSGNDADIVNTGTFEQKPNNPSKGFAYFCTDRQTTEGSTNGIMIYHKGNNVWVDALGRVVDDNYPPSNWATIE